MTSEEDRRVLEERASRLARPLEPPSWGAMVDLVGFSLANERYALDARYLRHVFRLSDISRLPGAEPPIYGVTPWHGELLTVLDLRALLGLPTEALNDLARVLVVGQEAPAFGVLADSVLGIESVAQATIRTPPEGVAARRDLLRGIAPGALLVLDAEELLRQYG